MSLSPSGQWVFGYGSLVDPSSFSATIGRELQLGVDFFEAEVAGLGRRWNYGVMHLTAFGPGPGGATIDYTLVALGVVRAATETVNGVVGWVEPDEVALLDRRERHYDRIDVTDRTTVHRAHDVSAPVAVYVPRHAAIERYQRARDAGRAAIEQRYWDLVDRAFAAFGPDAHARYHGSTPAPDVPVLSLSRRSERNPH
jgi:cation transport regulator ChaC